MLLSQFFKKFSMALILSTTLLPAFAAEKLVFALDLIRHGDRTAIGELPTAPHHWSEGRGQLTALGMQQEYQLGLNLKQRYKIDTPLLPTHYHPNTIYIRSTDYDRTIMSALSLLMGLYPLGTGPNLADSKPALPANYQPIPIHTVPTAQDTAFLIDMDSDEIAQVVSNHVYTRADWKEKSKQLEPKFARWSELTGLPVESLEDVLYIADTLNTYLAHDVPLPEGLSKQEAQEIIEAGQWTHATLFKPQPMGQITGKRALQNIVEYLQHAVEHKTKTKFVLLSAHDVTLLAVMSALHVPLESSPPYASDLNFSLYESDSGAYSISIMYNNKPVNIPGCQRNVCDWNEFLKSI
jgi:hypothetical protein